MAERFSDPEKNPTVKNSWAVRFQNFKTQESLRFPIRLPKVEANLELQSATFFSRDITIKDRTYTYDVWSGSIKGAKQQGTFMLIRSKEGILRGDLHFDGTHYAIQSLYNNEALLLEKQVLPGEAYKCGVEEKASDFSDFSESNSTSPYCNVSSQQCHQPFIIVSVYTEELYDSLYNFYSATGMWYAVLQVYSELARGAINLDQILMNNNISTSNITFHWEMLPENAIQFSSNMSIVGLGQDLNKFEVYARQNYRPIYNQDIAILQTHRTYGDQYGIASGIPVEDNGWNPNFAGYALASHNSIGAPRYTYTHELGHCLGARHDNDLSQSLLCGRGMIFSTSANKGRTVMAQLDTTEVNQGKSRILYFSNPDQTYTSDDNITYTIGAIDQNNKIIVENVLCNDIPTGAPRPGPKLPVIDFKTEKNSIFPNPTNGRFLLPFQIGTQSYSILDSHGRIIQNQKVAADQVQQAVDISKQPNGLYFIRIEQENTVTTLKIIKNE